MLGRGMAGGGYLRRKYYEHTEKTPLRSTSYVIMEMVLGETHYARRGLSFSYHIVLTCFELVYGPPKFFSRGANLFKKTQTKKKKPLCVLQSVR